MTATPPADALPLPLHRLPPWTAARPTLFNAGMAALGIGGGMAFVGALGPVAVGVLLATPLGLGALMALAARERPTAWFEGGQLVVQGLRGDLRIGVAELRLDAITALDLRDPAALRPLSMRLRPQAVHGLRAAGAETWYGGGQVWCAAVRGPSLRIPTTRGHDLLLSTPLDADAFRALAARAAGGEAGADAHAPDAPAA